MKPTGSKLHRIWKCPASAVLPQSEVARPEFEPAANRGKAIHAFLENVKRVGRAAALADAPEDLRPLLDALDLDDLPVHLACEVALAWNWRTSAARELGRSPDLPRRADGAVDYDALGVDWSSEIPCTLDVVGVASYFVEATSRAMNLRGYVGDYKSGHSKYPAPDMFAQTLLGASCVRSAWGCDEVVVELIHIHDNGGHHRARRTVDEWDLDVFEREITAAMGRVEWAEHAGWTTPYENEPDPVEGPWCEWCPAFRACPAKLALVRQIPDHLVTLGIRPDPESGALTLTPGALTVRNAADAWMMAERVQDILNRIKEEICSIAAFEEIPLADGRVIGHVHTERRSLNGRIAAEVLEQRYGREERDKRIEISVTMDALYKAAAANRAEGEKIETKNKTGAYDRLLAEVERRGGVEVNTTDAVKPHVPKKKRLT